MLSPTGIHVVKHAEKFARNDMNLLNFMKIAWAQILLRVAAVSSLLLIVFGTFEAWPEYSSGFVNGGAIGLILGFFVSERWRQKAVHENDRLQEVATTDPLTHLGNRRLMEAELNRKNSLFRRRQTPFSIIIIDADHFKQINDTRGHDVGDRVLQALSRTVTTTLRDIDMLFRMGGEEFVALLPDTGLSNARIVAQRIKDAVCGMVVADNDRLLTVTVSQGVAEVQADESVDSLLKRADLALYAAKQNGRNTFYYHAGDLDSEPQTGEEPTQPAVFTFQPLATMSQVSVG